MSKHPIADGWNQILDAAPSAEERKTAEGWKIVFYGGAEWLWNQYCKIDDEDELQEFVDGLEAELEAFRHEQSKRMIQQ